ncbi:hypothetical protein [Pelagicoccus sp. SDUM812005]|uniref:hypothetical protein n=1 Tax=Pelagicoccus sp. SDUM812005 TaxID=3041257 RepID=UPI00280F2F88|nr:hypothetical protein [Pelagicoccus sp. SDUM812005]MDQ8182180.1 hypothetical protein [Pelagicoccus sp. SDUM812005]
MKKPSVYPDKQSGKFICDFHILVDGEIKQRRLKFKTRAQAEEEQKKQEAKRKRAARKGKGTLTAAQHETAVWLFHEIDNLNWEGVTVREIMKHFRSTYNPTGSLLFSAAIEDFKKYKEGSGLKKSSMAAITPRLEKLKESLGNRRVRNLGSSDLLRYVRDQPEGMRYKIYVLLRELLDYESNPGRMSPILRRKILDEFEFESKKGMIFKQARTAAPTILHVDEVRAALRQLVDFRVREGTPGEWLGIFILGTYCGLRPHEIQALGRIQRGQPGPKESKELPQEYKSLGDEAVWVKHIQLSKGIIVCDGQVGTKTAERRNVTIRPNALEWLKYIKEKNLPLCVSDRRYARDAKYYRIAVMDEERQRDKRWNDVFRHTFATFLWNLEGITESEYTSQLGHSMKVAKDNYIGDIHDTEDSKGFFSLSPKIVLGA